MKELIVLIQCSDEVGLIKNITGIIAKHGLNITSMHEFVDQSSKTFFTRIECSYETVTFETLHTELKQSLPANGQINLLADRNKKIAVLVTKEFHCLAEILVRNQFKTLGADVQCVIGNYNELSDFTKQFALPYHYISHEEKRKETFEQEIENILLQYEFDYVVLAKFMRILSPAFVEKYKHKIINIHHSFLPAFAGANPYRQAFERGVKIIGATAHFVTDNLDEGPIITQHTIGIDHTYSVKELVRQGKEIEKAVIAEALQLVFDDRVFITGNKTIVFK